MSIIEEQTQASAVSASGSLLDEIMAQARITPVDEGYNVAKQGIAALVANILDNGNTAEPVNKALVDSMIVELDKTLSKQVDVILHAKPLHELESSWRSLKLLVDRTDFRENIKLLVLHATKEELLDDFEFTPEITQSGFYKHVYSSGYGQFGGQPIGGVIGDYAMTQSAPDIKLLQYVSAVGAMAHAPFVSSVAPTFFGVDSFTELPTIKDLKSVFEGPIPSGVHCVSPRMPATWD